MGEREHDPREWATKTLRWDKHQFREIIEALAPQDRDSSAILMAINDFSKRMEKHMATQEERLRVISAQVSEVKTLLADLRANNPDIEDEIAEIEAKLAAAPVEPPVEPPAEPPA